MAPPNQKKTTQKEKLAAKKRTTQSGSMNPYAVKKATGSPKVNAAINNLVQAIIRDNSTNTQALRRTTASQAKATSTKAAAAKNPNKTGAEGPKKRAGSTRRSSGSSAGEKKPKQAQLRLAPKKVYGSGTSAGKKR